MIKYKCVVMCGKGKRKQIPEKRERRNCDGCFFRDKTILCTFGLLFFSVTHLYQFESIVIAQSMKIIKDINK